MAASRPLGVPRVTLKAAQPYGTVAVLTAWCLLAVGDAFNDGQFSRVALSCVTLGFVVLAAVVTLRLPLHVPGTRELWLPIGVSVAAAAVLPTRHFMHLSPHDLRATQLLTLVTAVLAAATLLLPDPVDRRRLWWVTLAVAVATGVTTVVLASDPGIDVWYLLQQSSTGLLHGDDMYRQHWAHSTGLQDVYPYLPITTIVLAPFRWLLGDVRYGLLAAMLLSTWLLRRLAPKAPVALAALVLVVPHWTFLVDQSWTEPLLLAALGGSILAMKRDRPAVAVLALAAALACKQHMILLLPLYAVWPAFGWRRTLTAAVAAGVAVLPWFVAGPRDMLHDAVHANLALGVLLRALCLPSLFARWGFTVGFWFLLLVLAATYLLVLRRVPRTPSGLAIGSALVLWALDLANKQSFFNHYTLPLGLLLVALAASEPATRHPEAEVRREQPRAATAQA